MIKLQYLVKVHSKAKKKNCFINFWTFKSGSLGRTLFSFSPPSHAFVSQNLSDTLHMYKLGQSDIFSKPDLKKGQSGPKLGWSGW